MRDPEALRSWAAGLAQAQLVWAPRVTLEEFEEKLRSRAVSAGRRERRLRKRGRAELQLRPRLDTELDKWQQEANPARASGAVRRPPGTWDLPSVRVEKRTAKRLKVRDRFRAAKGEAADRDETWGFERVERTRVRLPARYVQGSVVLEALLVWRGEWGDEQMKWTPVTNTYFPQAKGSAQMASIIARFEAEHGERGKRQKTAAVAAPIIQGTRRQPDRGQSKRRTKRRSIDGGEDDSEDSSDEEPGANGARRPLAKALRAAIKRAGVLRARANRLKEIYEAARKARRVRRMLTAASERAALKAANTDAIVDTIQRRHDEFKRRVRDERSERIEQGDSKRQRREQ